MESNNFIDELIAEAELKDENRTLAYYDLLVMEVAKLENQIASNFAESNKEVEIIKEWSLKKNSVIQERINFIKLKLESYIRECKEKTIHLPHGQLKIRKMPDKVEIFDMNTFLANANSQMLSVVPESLKPDLTKIKSYMKLSTKIPDGVKLIEGEDKFILTINQKENQNDDTSEI